MRIKTDKIYLASSNFPTTPSTKTWKLVRAAIKEGIFGLTKSPRLLIDTFNTGPTLSAGTFDRNKVIATERDGKIIRYGDEITTYQIDFNNKLYNTGKMSYKGDLTRDVMIIDVFSPDSYSEDWPMDEYTTTWADILLNVCGDDKEKIIKSIEYFYVVRDTRSAFKVIYCIVPGGEIIVKTHLPNEEIGKYIDGELVLFGDHVHRVKNPHYIESIPEEAMGESFEESDVFSDIPGESNAPDKGTWFDPIKEMKKLLDKQSNTIDLMLENMGKLLDVSKADNGIETWTPSVGMFVLIDGEHDPWTIVDFNSRQNCFWVKQTGLTGQSGTYNQYDHIDERVDILTNQISEFIDDCGQALHDDLIDEMIDMQDAISRQSRSFIRRSSHSNLGYRRGGQASDDDGLLLRRVDYTQVKPFKIEL